MSKIHVYTAEMQPATNYVDRTLERALGFRCANRRLRWAWCCRKKRWAQNLLIQVYYDDRRYWCRDGKGCKALKVRVK